MIQTARLPWHIERGAEARECLSTGEFRSLGGAGARLFDVRMDPARALRRDRIRQPIRLAMVLEGRLQVRTGNADGGLCRLEPGELYLLDLRCISQAQWSRLHLLWLVLPDPRTMDVPGTIAACVRVGDTSIAAALHAQMRMLAEHGDALTPRAIGHVCASLLELSLHVRQEIRQAERPPTPASLALQAAQQFLQAHHHVVDLRVDDVARAVGCSRTSLCRLFASQSLTVAGYLRELRLVRCRQTLASSTARVNIAQLAFRHGFADLHAFSRLFKRRFGITPGQARGTSG